MWLIDQIAEQYIAQAIARGELDDLPGAGEPISLDDDRWVPEELRAGYRLLKNAGFVPPEVESLRQLRDLESLLARVTDPEQRDIQFRRLRALESHLKEGRGRGLAGAARTRYHERLLARLGG